MRAIMNISLPEPMAELVNQVVATGQYSTKSEFFRSLLRDWQGQELSRKLSLSRKELISGKGKLLRSLKDLR